MPDLVLLGPQRLEPTVKVALECLGIAGRVATITAGWEERELEDDELRDHLEGRTVNLNLWERGEAVFEEDPALFEGMRARLDRIRTLHRLYRTRLGHAMAAARELHASTADPEVLEPEIESAIQTIRSIDDDHLSVMDEIHARFEDEFHVTDRDAVRKHRKEIAAILEDVEVIAIAGGHVSILLNRMRMFGISSALEQLPAVAWSAGAMVLGEKIVLFHDSPPQGRGDAEVMDRGLEVYRDVIPFPHAKHRLLLERKDRVAILSRRLAPAALIPMDGGERLIHADGDWAYRPETRTMKRDGRVVMVNDE